MKIKTLVLPILSLSLLCSCNGSSKLKTDEPYYYIDTQYPRYGDRFEKEKSSFMVLRDGYIFGWSYKSETDNFSVMIAHKYFVRGDTLFYHQVDDRFYSTENVKFGDKKIYGTLENKIKDYDKNRELDETYKVFGTIDDGVIKTFDKDYFYAIYSVAKDVGYAK